MNSNTFKFYTEPRAAWDAMLEAIAAAEVSIDIEQYIFLHDDVGQEFVKILKEKAEAGVKVRILLDHVGSYGFYISPGPETLRASRAIVKFFNPISPWRIPSFTSWFFRDHNKLLVVDQKLAFTGGLGIQRNMADWRDTMGSVEGPAVAEMTAAFEEIWQHAGGQSLFLKIKEVRTYQKRKFFITNTPYFKKRFLYHTLVRAMAEAKERIWLTTPYFIPNRKISKVLRLAARRGVDVRVILPKKFDVLAVGSASQSTFTKFLEMGVKIFEYQPTFIHAKSAIVDGDWATFGSFNLDSLSFTYNFEGNIVTAEKECVTELEKHFLMDLEQTKEIKLAEWRHRSWFQKFREVLLRPIRGFL